MPATAAYADLRKRIDRIVLVTASDEDKIARYVARVCTCGMGMEKAEADARSRLAHQIPDRKRSRAPIMCLKTPAISSRCVRR